MIAQPIAPQVQRRGPQIRGIVAAAAAIGCTRQHLYEVLHGRRQSPRILEAYRKLPGAIQTPIPSPNPQRGATVAQSISPIKP